MALTAAERAELDALRASGNTTAGDVANLQDWRRRHIAHAHGRHVATNARIDGTDAIVGDIVTWGAGVDAWGADMQDAVDLANRRIVQSRDMAATAIDNGNAAHQRLDVVDGRVNRITGFLQDAWMETVAIGLSAVIIVWGSVWLYLEQGAMTTGRILPTIVVDVLLITLVIAIVGHFRTRDLIAVANAAPPQQAPAPQPQADPAAPPTAQLPAVPAPPPPPPVPVP
jgi:hypothetical protein